MAKAKKFGTFGGVFVPSLLTILGVIMYLRLPWIVAQGGLFYTIVIIVVAHIISITTGLSVSSIATDKKVEAGGNYYIISRSMGLPIGGTLGIALFIGLSFSVSLYVIGFTESLLFVLDIPVSKEAIQLYGSITIVLITIIVFVSTSLALKAQYLILVAVLLSIASIFLGSPELALEDVALNPIVNGESLFVVFAIFFPAVTGFTAGVQMSGDLKDPKKSIPFGTIAAIGIGFVIYISLAVFLAYNVQTDQLLSNPNIIVEIAWNPQLVVAGIWGATISSAMGSILGAPRILQATSRDKITPKFFAKGSGGLNEPRRALILTFLIAEAGILIGDLNVIARIVSIFFISTYGLINLSYVLESWASTDFRPTFKVPIWVGIVGALSSAIIMFELDVMAFVVATVVLSLLYLFLKRKVLTLESGDTWGSFWSSVVRTGLHKLNDFVIHKRNWSPNLLLFRGAENSRTHLLEFGKWIVGKVGIVTDFELVESKNGNLKFTKASQQVKMVDAHKAGIFHRRYECADIFTGIESVSQFYGFSGVEPNTVLLGWPRNSEHPGKATSLFNKLKSLDYNILLLDHGKENGFKSFKNIDVWWRGGSNNAALALALLRFIQVSDEWKEAEIRILIIIDDSALVNKVHSNMLRLLQGLRQDAEVKIINNSIEKRSFNEILRIESGESDLTIMGLPDFENGGEEFINKSSKLIKDLNSVLFIWASSYFEPFYIGIERVVESHVKSKLEEVKSEHKAIELPKDEVLAKRILDIHNEINDSLNEFYRSYILEIEQDFKTLGKNIESQIISSFQILSKNLKSLDTELTVKLITRIQRESFSNSQKLLQAFKSENLIHLESSIESGIENIISVQKEIINNCPETEMAYFDRNAISLNMKDSAYVKFYKSKKLVSLKLFKWDIRVPIKIKMFLKHHINGFLRRQLLQHVKQIGLIGYDSISELQKIFSRIQDVLRNLEIYAIERGHLDKKKIDDAASSITLMFNSYNDNVESDFAKVVNSFAAAHHQSFQNKIKNFNLLQANSIIRKNFRLKKISITGEKLQSLSGQWSRNMILMIDFAEMEIMLILFKNRLRRLLFKWESDLEKLINDKLGGYFDTIESLFDNYKSGQKKDELKKLIAVQEETKSIELGADTSALIKEVQKNLKDLPELVDVMSEGSFKALEENQFEEQDVVSVYLRRLVSYLVDTEFLQDLKDEVTIFNASLKEAVIAIEDTQRLIISGISNAENPFKIDTLLEEEDLDNLIEHSVHRLSGSKEKIESLVAGLQKYVNKRLIATFDRLTPYLVTHTTNNLKQYIFSQEQRKVLSGLEKTKQSLYGFIQKIAVTLQYSKSEGLLFAKRLNKLEEKETTSIDKMITFTQNYSPDGILLKNLPRYYTQLFSGESSISRQFLVNQKNIDDQVERIYKRYKEGFSGAFLIKGNPHSGKTALSRNIAHNYFAAENIFWVNPVPGGSISPESFNKSITESTGHNGTVDQIFESLAQDSVVIINDLEMWWERSVEGFKIIDLLLHLIDNYGNKILFIMNVNSFSFRLINNIQNIEKSFVGVINVDPFNAKDIETAILQRHSSTGIKFEYNGRFESQMSDIRRAGIFNDIFKYSNGCIGVSLLSWLTMIDDYSGDKIEIKKLPKPDWDILSSVENEWNIWLTQFVLHKELTISRLCRIFNIDEKSVKQTIEALQRSGFVVKGINNSLKINPFIEHLFIDQFSRMGMIWNN